MLPEDLEFSGTTFGEFEIKNYDDDYEDIRVAKRARAGCESIKSAENIGIFATSINGCFVL